MNSPRLLDVYFQSQFGNENDLHGLMILFRILSFFLVTGDSIKLGRKGWLHNLDSLGASFSGFL